MKPVRELNFGFPDAENYKKKKNKSFLNNVIIDDELEKIMDEDVYFLIGEKGTGKTAYSVFLSNNDYKNTISEIKYVRETDYSKFINMKENYHLTLSEYETIWKVILLMLICDSFDNCIDKSNPIKNYINYQKIKNVINEYNKNRFGCEVASTIEFIRNIEDAISLIAEQFGISFKENYQEKSSETKFNSYLIDLLTKFEDAIKGVRLNKSFILFIDGIDIKPVETSKDAYIECLKGLAHAVWSLNNDFFPRLKGNQSNYIKIVLLTRPDIFNKFGLQNMNGKIRGNSVVLNWNTKYSEYASSSLYKYVNNLLAYSNSKEDGTDYFNHYFNYKIWNHSAKRYSDSPFIDILRNSFYRPRDIVEFLTILQLNTCKDNSEAIQFSQNIFKNSRDDFSNYLMGEIKDYLTFYYTEEEYENFLYFFNFTNGKNRFDYEEYEIFFQNYCKFMTENEFKLPSFVRTKDELLQLLYELNIICYIDKSDDEDYFHYCFRERSYFNLSPKVKTNSNYKIHQGLEKALNIGNKEYK